MSMTKLNRNIKERVSDKSIGYKEHLFHFQDISIPLIIQSYKLWTEPIPVMDTGSFTF